MCRSSDSFADLGDRLIVHRNERNLSIHFVHGTSGSEKCAQGNTPVFISRKMNARTGRRLMRMESFFRSTRESWGAIAHSLIVSYTGWRTIGFSAFSRKQSIRTTSDMAQFFRPLVVTDGVFLDFSIPFESGRLR